MRIATHEDVNITGEARGGDQNVVIVGCNDDVGLTVPLVAVLEDCGLLVYRLSCRQEVNFVKSAGCYLSGRVLFNGGDEAYLHTRGRLSDLERIKQGFTGGLGNNVGG